MLYGRLPVDSLKVDGDRQLVDLLQIVPTSSGTNVRLHLAHA